MPLSHTSAATPAPFYDSDLVASASLEPSRQARRQCWPARVDRPVADGALTRLLTRSNLNGMLAAHHCSLPPSTRPTVPRPSSRLAVTSHEIPPLTRSFVPTPSSGLASPATAPASPIPNARRLLSTWKKTAASGKWSVIPPKILFEHFAPIS